MAKKIIRFFIIIIALFIFFIGIGILTVYVNDNGDFKHEEVYDYGVVFGAAIRSKGKLSETLKSRMQTAIRLYQKGVIKKMILSGSGKNQVKPGEPKAMLLFALANQVKEEDIILDEGGVNTLKTLLYIAQFSRNFNSSPKILFISSYFHLARIKMSANILGIKNFNTFPSEVNHPKVFYFVFREAVAIWFYMIQSFYHQSVN
jgi:vancomycin permeability regulator SanA